MTSAKVSLDDRIQLWLMTLLRISVVIGGCAALYLREWGPFAYSVLALILMYLPALIKARTRVNLPVEFDVVLVLFMYAAVFLGKVGHAYEHFWWWDAALHTSAGFLLGYVAFLALYINVQQGKIKSTRLVFGLLIFCIALAFGAMWEIFEFGLDGLLGGNLQRGSLHDTMWDLIVDSVGALIMARIGVSIIFDKPRGLIGRLTDNFVRANPGFIKEKK